MDRDDHSPALITTTSTALTVPRVSFSEALPKLPQDARNEVLALLPLMKEIAAAAKKLPAITAIAKRTSRSAETLRRWYYKRFAILGAAGLVDHRKCGGCGLEGCTATEREIILTAAVIQRWQGRVATNDKRGLSESWKSILRELISGESIEDAGTWRDLYAAAYPFREPPAVCPWSIHRPPPGWSLSTFLRHKPAKVVNLLARKGSFEAWPHLPEVRVDLSTLKPMEWLVVDDHRLDFKVFVDVPGRGVQLVEMWGLFVMDVATRMIVSFGLKPRIEREDGTFVAFEHRDMQHLMFHVLGTYGVPQDFTQTWIVENAAAAVSTECENLVSFVTHGRVKIKRTGIQVGDFTLSGFPERWGNYRGKRWLEVWFAALDIVLGGVKGQMGSDYWSKPGSFDARQAFGNRLLKLLDKCTAETRAKLALPFEWAGEAHWLVSDAIELLNHRQDHRLEGFEEVRFFSYDHGSAMIPLHPQLATLHGFEEHLKTFSLVPKELQELWLNQGGSPRCITPAEKMALNMPRMQRLSREAMLDLLFDEVTTWKGEALLYKGGDVLDIEVRRGREKQKVRLSGLLPGVEIGTRVIARLNTDHLECGAWILNEARQLLGHMTHSGTPTHEDIDGLHQMLGAQIKALKQASGIAERLTNRRRDAQKRVGDLAELTQTIHTLRNQPADADDVPELPAPDASRELAQAIATTTTSERETLSRAALRQLRKAAA